MTLLSRKYIILAKVESSEDSDASPTGANDAVQVQNLQLSWPNEVHDRDFGSTSHSPFKPIQGRKYGQLTFDVELKGSGTAGTAPDLGALLRGCYIGETVNVGTDVTYDPVTDSPDSLTIYAYRDGLLYKFTGCRGNPVFKFSVGQVPMLSFTFMGHAVDVSDDALPSPTFDATVPEVVKNASFSIGGYSAAIANLELDMGNGIGATDDMNHASGYGRFIAKSRRTAQGSFDPEATLVATNDFWSQWEDGTEQALSITIGATAGNIITFTAPKIVHRELSEGDRDGVLTYEIPFTAARDTGDDEFQLVLT